MSNGFITILKNINTKSGLLDPDFIDENYVPFAVNRVFARTPDGLLVAAELNERHGMTKYEQYRWYYHRLSKNSRRFGEKVEIKKPKYLQMVMDYFDFSKAKAQVALTILTDRELQEIESTLDKGGVQNE
jgi:hypothetical protein